jgi:formylglycine-generating enzyme required for sulfatase activity
MSRWSTGTNALSSSLLMFHLPLCSFLLLIAQDDRTRCRTLPLPIFVPLSAYAAHRRSLKPHDDRTLATFISHYLFARQTSFALPDDFFRHLLRQGRAVLLLDGLDEVPDETERAQVRQAIEDLVTGREGMRLVVTCRSAAYQGRTALGKGFHQISVRPLAEEHIAALVEHAYAHLYRTDALLRQQKTEELLAGITQLEADRRARLGEKMLRLIDSPLLVRMLLIVHYRDRRLPEQRAELYIKATDAMLLPDYAPDAEMADAIGQLIGGSWEVHRDLVQHLAFHMHRRGEKQGREIQEADLRRILAAEPAYAPLEEPFVKLTRLRGTLLEERFGSYRYLHLAFQEYLAARYLAEIVRSDGGVQAMVAFLETGPLLESWWREVILLVAGYFGVTSPQTAQSFLERLAGIDPAAAARPALPLKSQLAAAELAAVGWLEWPAQREELRQRLAGRLAALFANFDLVGQTKATLRVAAGRALSRLGDDRPGVGVDKDSGLPNIAWSAEIPAGTYRIGDNKGSRDENPPSAKVDWPFRLARYPITNVQFQCFVEAEDRDNETWWKDIPGKERQFSKPKWAYANQPRETVSWYQAMAFCRWLTQKLHDGMLPTGPLTGALKQYTITLPHEFEWEVAARWPNEAVQQRIYPWGPEFDVTKANTYEGDRVQQTTAVGMYPSGKNEALELHDMSGNVWEWCRNKYGKPADDAIDDSGDSRVVRGGSWDLNRNLARTAYRVNSRPDDRGGNYGFRVVVRISPSHHPDH